VKKNNWGRRLCGGIKPAAVEIGRGSYKAVGSTRGGTHTKGKTGNTQVLQDEHLFATHERSEMPERKDSTLLIQRGEIRIGNKKGVRRRTNKQSGSDWKLRND